MSLLRRRGSFVFLAVAALVGAFLVGYQVLTGPPSREEVIAALEAKSGIPMERAEAMRALGWMSPRPDRPFSVAGVVLWGMFLRRESELRQGTETELDLDDDFFGQVLTRTEGPIVPTLPGDRCRSVRLDTPIGGTVHGKAEYALGLNGRVLITIEFVLSRDGLGWRLLQLRMDGEDWGVVFDEAGNGALILPARG